MSRRFITIHFNDGSKLSASFPQQSGDPSTLASKVHKAIAASSIALECEGTLTVVPMTNVKYVEVHPAPEKLPDSVIAGARLGFD